MIYLSYPIIIKIINTSIFIFLGWGLIVKIFFSGVSEFYYLIFILFLLK